MRNLKFLTARFSKVKLAKLLKLESANISIWEKNDMIPLKHHVKLAQLRKEHKNVPKRKG